MRTIIRCSLLITVFLSIGLIYAQEAVPAPVPVQAALFLKLLPFDTKLSGDITIYVIGNDDFAKELKKAVGKPIGKAVLKDVITGSDVPNSNVSIIYINDPAMVEKVTTFTRSSKILSISGEPGIVQKGISLGVGVSNEKATILLNISASKEEGVDWNPAILKIALTVK